MQRKAMQSRFGP